VKHRRVGAAVAIVIMASASSFAVACSSASDADPSARGMDGGTPSAASPGAGGGSDPGHGDDSGPGSDDRAGGGCAPANGSYAVTYTETASAGTGCELVDGGSRTATEAYPAEGVAGDGGLPDGCACHGSALSCTFTSTLRGVSTSTTTLEETFTADGFSGSVSHQVNNLDGGVIYSCTQSVSATKNAL
jgi:hypothetical protein